MSLAPSLDPPMSQLHAMNSSDINSKGDTCWPHDYHYGSEALLIHMLARIFPSIIGTQPQDLVCYKVCALTV